MKKKKAVGLSRISKLEADYRALTQRCDTIEKAMYYLVESVTKSSRPTDEEE